MAHYIVMVIEEEQQKYLFNTRMLVDNAEMARKFSDLILAKRYVKKSRFSNMRYSILTIEHDEPKADWRCLGSIVE